MWDTTGPTLGVKNGSKGERRLWWAVGAGREGERERVRGALETREELVHQARS